MTVVSFGGTPGRDSEFCTTWGEGRPSNILIIAAIIWVRFLSSFFISLNPATETDCWHLYGGKTDQSRHTTHHMPRIQETHLSSMIPSRGVFVTSRLHQELHSTGSTYPWGISWLKTFVSFLRSPSKRFRLRKEDAYLTEWLRGRIFPHSTSYILPLRASRPRTPASIHPTARGRLCIVMTVLFASYPPLKTSLSSSSRWLLAQVTFLPSP